MIVVQVLFCSDLYQDLMMMTTTTYRTHSIAIIFIFFNYPPENFLYKMGGLKALTSMSFCSERLFFCIFMYFKND